MKYFSVIIMGLVVIGLTVFGCAYMPGQSDSGWIILIDGPNGLENWNQVGSSNWAVVDGVVQADKRADKEAGFLVSKNSYKDFIIRAEFWVSDDANSGIFLRCQDPKKITDKSCYEANIYDQRPDPSFGTGQSSIWPRYRRCPKPAANGIPMRLRPEASRLSWCLTALKPLNSRMVVLLAAPLRFSMAPAS
jgi:3-keto-disaccharide hydrolase